MISHENLSEKEIFPVNIKVERQEIWVVWRMKERRDEAFLKIDGNLMWASTEADLFCKLGLLITDLIIEEKTLIDLDELILNLSQKSIVDFEKVLNAINLLDDFALALQEQKRTGFSLIEQKLTLYDKVFSCTGSADLVGAIETALSENERSDLLLWLSLGAKMVLENTIWSIN
jgi:hypothetical protein